MKTTCIQHDQGYSARQQSHHILLGDSKAAHSTREAHCVRAVPLRQTRVPDSKCMADHALARVAQARWRVRLRIERGIDERVQSRVGRQVGERRRRRAAVLHDGRLRHAHVEARTRDVAWVSAGWSASCRRRDRC
jgi:hypothetical protein